MTARILVVDDVPSNVRLLEARLIAEYFCVLTASNGAAALSICEQGKCDIILLDVMMPEMDGFEVCRRLKENSATMHIPVIMVTALDSLEDRVRGLEAGADDFLAKPVNDLALVTRVKSLVRLKMITDDLRMRAESGEEIALDHFRELKKHGVDEGLAQLVIVDDRETQYRKLVDSLSARCNITMMSDADEALIQIAEGKQDLVIVSLGLEGSDGLRLCSHLRSLERTRNLPILVVTEVGQDDVVSRALELGANDYVHRPLDTHELRARIATQLKRKRYNDCLRSSVQQTIEMAVKDSLTQLYNRHYFENHFSSLFEKAVANERPMSAIMLDIDHFKAVNDTHGHDVGDAVIRECAARLRKTVRGIDLACRFGGEEFVVIMPDTDIAIAEVVAERIRLAVCGEPVVVNAGECEVSITISLGVSGLEADGDTHEKLLKRADIALYNAKRNGRNQVMSEAA